MVTLINGCGPVPGQGSDASGPVGTLAAHRAELAAEAERIIAAADARGIDAFATWLQMVADRAVATLGPTAPADSVARWILDDLVDLALGSRLPVVQRLLMVTPPLWAGPPVELERFGTTGFSGAFQSGDGALRHMALTAAGAWVFPPMWVEAAARLWGRDLVPIAGTDSAGDIAANARGRALATWLRQADRATLADGRSVADWTRRAVGAAVP